MKAIPATLPALLLAAGILVSQAGESAPGGTPEAGERSPGHFELVDDFEHYPVTIVGRFMGRSANGNLGGEWEAYPSGNRMWDARIQVVDDSQVLMVRNQNGGNARAALISGLTNPIESHQAGSLFFRFRIPSDGREGAAVRAFAGLYDGSVPGVEPSEINAGFGIRGEAGEEMVDLVSLGDPSKSRTRIRLDQWYDTWIVADNAGNVFDLYLAPVETIGSAARLPQVTDRVLEAHPFSAPTDQSLQGALFLCPEAPGGTQWFQIDQVHWNGNERFTLPKAGRSPGPDPMTWDAAPSALNPTRISMTASRPGKPSHPVEYFFENVTDPDRSSGWQSSPGWIDEGLSDNTPYAYRVKARYTYANEQETGWSEIVTAVTPEEDDTQPPAPNPMSWAAEPEVVWRNFVKMTATAAEDAEGNTPIQYYFANLSDPARDSGWQDEPTFMAGPLDHGTEYSYRVKASDSSANFNETEWSPVVTVETGEEDALLPYRRKLIIRQFPSLGTDVPVRVYHRNSQTDSDGAPVIVYVKNHGYPRSGQEPDETILGDFIDDGYLVITLDFNGHPDAVSPDFDSDLDAFVKAIHGYRTASILEGTGLRAHAKRLWFVPAGSRLERDVVYFDLGRHGSHGTKEQVLRVWNNNPNLRRFDLPELTDPEDMHNPDGSPLDWKLRMDIIYPSRPNRELPLIVFASSNSTRSFSRTTRYRPHMAGFKMRGYAFAHIDHCYNPLARHWSYGHFEGFSDGYSLAPWNGVKADSAAIRYLRKHAPQYGIDGGRVGLWSISKSTYSASLMANPHHAERGEQESFDGFAPGSPEPQPWQGYSSRVDAVALPSAPRRFVSPENVPTLIAAGRFDGFNHWERWLPIIESYEAKDVNHLALWMEDAAHDLPLGYSPVLGVDFYALAHRFFDQYLKSQQPPEVLYTIPKHGSSGVARDGRSQAIPDKSKLPGNALDHVAFKQPVTVHFGQPMEVDSVRNGGVRVERKEDGTRVPGEWRAFRGNTYFQFLPEESLRPGTAYCISFAETARNRDGLALAGERCVEFKTVSD